VQVQNKLQLAVPQLPGRGAEGRHQVTQSSNGYLLIAGLLSRAITACRASDVANYVVSPSQDRSAAINGVGNFNVFGTQYAMRIWLDADKLNSFALTPVDVSNAITNQNVQVAGGQLGGTPAPRRSGSPRRSPRRRCCARREFGDILLKVERRRIAGAHARRRARRARARELLHRLRYNGQPRPASASSSHRRERAATANAVRAQDRRAAPYFPHGCRSCTRTTRRRS
jgi:multidrug efflux pump